MCEYINVYCEYSLHSFRVVSLKVGLLLGITLTGDRLFKESSRTDHFGLVIFNPLNFAQRQKIHNNIVQTSPYTMGNSIKVCTNIRTT